MLRDARTLANVSRCACLMAACAVALSAVTILTGSKRHNLTGAQMLTIDEIDARLTVIRECAYRAGQYSLRNQDAELSCLQDAARAHDAILKSLRESQSDTKGDENG